VYRVIANYSTASLWLISVKDTVNTLVKGGDLELIQFTLSVLGGIYTVVLIVNKILDGIVNRQQTKLENERLALEIWELEDDIDLKDRYEEL
tara:strand:- start:58 stop:333 length:276 start_codon:yes stop_codon:yes gene_type:complete